MSLERILQILDQGVWGTVGPYSLKAAAMTARITGTDYCLLTHSAGAALETILRALGIGHDDLVLVSTIGDRFMRTCPNLVGAEVISCGNDKSVLSLTDVQQAEKTSANLSAVILNPFSTDDLEEIYNDLGRKNIPLILWAGGKLRDKYNNVPLCHLSDAVIYSFSEGSDIYAGNGGALVTCSKQLYKSAFALHNCGRVEGEGATLEFKDYIGGNMRITEFQAAVIYDQLSAED